MISEYVKRDGPGGISGLNGSDTAVFSIGSSGTARLGNLSSRVEVGGTSGTPIAGSVSAGYGVSGAINDPQFVLYQASTELASYDNWSDASNAAEVAAAASQAGAFALAGGSKDAATLTNLGAGAYTVVASGAGDSSGTALFELYVVD